eukprot:Skav234559  [mRNA]  locus=scaffold2556:497961:515995:+ [translate_table: standard]
MPATPGLLRSLGLEMCADFKRGNCHRGERCKFSHGDGTGREPFGIEMCADFKRGACFRDHCKFSHGESAPQIARVVPVVPRLGVEMCADFKRGACFRERCRFSHGEPLGEMSSLSSLSLNGSSNLPSALPSALPSPQSANLDVAEAAAKAAAALMAKETPKTREPHGPKIEVGSDVQFFHNGTWTIGTALAYSADGEKLTVLTDSEQLEASRSKENVSGEATSFDNAERAEWLVQLIHNLKRLPPTFWYSTAATCLLSLQIAQRLGVSGVAKSPEGLAPVRAIFAHGIDEVSIKVSDEGIPRSELAQVWSYSSVDSSSERLGVGLPLSRLHARYYGGDVVLKSMEGFGTDVYVFLNRLGQSCENLPQGVRLSPAQLDSSINKEAICVEREGREGTEGGGIEDKRRDKRRDKRSTKKEKVAHLTCRLRERRAKSQIAEIDHFSHPITDAVGITRHFQLLAATGPQSFEARKEEMNRNGEGVPGVHPGPSCDPQRNAPASKWSRKFHGGCSGSSTYLCIGILHCARSSSYFSMDLLDDASTLIACCVGAFLCHRPAPRNSNEIKLRLPYFAL